MITVCSGQIEPSLQAELEIFERGFTYPLDAHRTFRISHAPDYLCFFGRRGNVNCFISKNEDQVDGVLTTVERRLWAPGFKEPQKALYFCDLKIVPGRQRGRVFLQLAAEVRRHVCYDLSAAFGIVMHGTERTPDQYSGSFGIPKFEALAEVAIFRIPARRGSWEGVSTESSQTVPVVLEALRGEQLFVNPGIARSGSRYEPVGLIDSSGQACAVLEDTLESKRLFCDRGEELLSGHLSSFAYRSPAAGVRIVEAALDLCWERGISALFFSVPKKKREDWDELCQFSDVTRTGATIYGLGLPKGLDWNINTSEV